MRPLYLELSLKELSNKKDEALAFLKKCSLCPRSCKVNRLKDQRGFCGAGGKAQVSSYFAHFGEEDVLVGRYGSGTIFFSYCNLRCVFCQNYEISHLGEGKEVSSEELASQMLYLQSLGCHNINFVTPTHFVPQILEALEIAREKGLNIPLVYNCGGYESKKVIELLEGIIDIYMPDVKYSSPESSKKFSHAEDYFKVVKSVLKIMYNQVGDLIVNSEGIALRGLLIRHLVMPNKLASTENILKFIAEEVSLNTYINIMAQYRPCGQAYRYPEINRRILQKEYQEAIRIALSLGLRRLDKGSFLNLKLI